MVSLLDYYNILWFFGVYTFGDRSGERDQSRTDKQTLEARIQIESMGASTGSGKWVLGYMFLEGVCLALERDQFFPRERVLNTKELGLSEAGQ